MKPFKHKAFQKHMENWVERIEDMDMTRAWEIVKACLETHARVDQGDEETKEESLNLAYKDFALAFEDEPATYTMLGMLTELEQMCPHDAVDAFPEEMKKAIAKGRGEKFTRARKKEPEEKFTGLRLIQGGKI